LFREDLIDEVTKDKVPETVQPGDMLQAWTPQGPMPVKVLEVKEETVVLDANHPLAGKKLIFDLEVLEVS
jgi:FKBP-type peptidyl-prolyl cis-trans isomerase 2